jgi:hypothetical protein
MAVFCLATKMSPSEYRQLTRYEFEAFSREFNGAGETIWPDQ